MMHKHRLEKLLVTDNNFNLKGLITVKDILKSDLYPNSCKDEYEIKSWCCSWDFKRY